MIEDARERRKNKENFITCKQCNYKSSSKTLLTRHIQYQCNQCDYKSYSRTFLKGHIKAVHKSSSYNCDKCDYSTTTQDSLEAHIQTVHEKYQCNQCDYKSYSKTFLKGHMEAVHKALRYNCDKCDYITTTQDSLNVHRQSVHPNEKAGGQKPVEIEAEKKISGKKTYVSKRIKCELCQAKFNKKETHSKHMKEVHSRIPRTEENGIDNSNSKSTMTFRKSLRNNKITSRALEFSN